MNEGENLATLKSIVDLIGIEPDPLSFTYNQIQGLPLIINGGDYEPIINHGEAYPVQKARRLRNRKNKTISDNGTRISDEDYKEMFQRYLELDYENINSDDDNNYNRALGILLSLSRDVCYNIISEKVAYECADLLANIGAKIPPREPRKNQSCYQKLGK